MYRLYESVEAENILLESGFCSESAGADSNLERDAPSASESAGIDSKSDECSGLIATKDGRYRNGETTVP